MSMVYEERVICFIDILGFKAHIDKSIEDNGYINTILAALDTIFTMTKTEVDDAKDREVNLCITQFSDSVVASYKIESDDQLAFLVMSISDIIDSLLDDGFLLRGAITQGKVIHTDKQLFGPAMNEAYKLESECASYPRIIISRKVFKEAVFSDEYKNLAQERILGYCAVDDDGWHYINYIGGKRYGINPSSHLQHIQKLCKIIDKHIEISNPNILKKYNWINVKLSLELAWVEKEYDCMSHEERELLITLKKQVAQFDLSLKCLC